MTANEEHIEGGPVTEELDATCTVVGQRQLAVVGSMEECSIHTIGEIEGDVLIASAVVDTLSVLVLQLEGLPAEVHLAETFACTHKALVCLTMERNGSTLCLWSSYKPQRQGIVTRR